MATVMPENPMATRRGRVTLSDIAAAINAHLKRMEKDPKINSLRKGQTMRHFWNAGSWASGPRVFVTYVSYQGPSSLTRDEADKYLAYLDDGGTGFHWSAMKPQRRREGGL